MRRLDSITALVNDDAAQALRADQAKGALGGVQVAIRYEPVVQPRPLEGEIYPSFLGIIPTRGCNIACVYCNFGGLTTNVTHIGICN